MLILCLFANRQWTESKGWWVKGFVCRNGPTFIRLSILGSLSHLFVLFLNCPGQCDWALSVLIKKLLGEKVESVGSYTFSIKIRRRCAAGCGMVLIMYASCLLDTLYHSLWSRDSHIWSSYSSFSAYSTKPADGLGWMVCFVLPLAQPLQYFYSHFRHLWEYKSLDCLFYCIFCDWPTFWLQELLELSQSGDVFVRGTSRLVKLSPDQEHLKRPQSFIYKSEMSQIILALLSEVW